MSEAIETMPFAHTKNIGIQAILFACVLNGIMGAGFYLAHKIEPQFSTLTGVFVRVLCNLVWIAPLLTQKKQWRIRPWRGHRSLWLWAMFGVGTTTTFFSAIPLIGAGIVSFLNAGSGVFIALFAPFLARQKTSLGQWLGVIGCLFGLFLISNPDIGALASLGAGLAILSGLSSGLAYLMVARARKNFSPEVVMFHWAIANIVFLLPVFFLFPLQWPQMPLTWIVITGTGLVAAAAQYLTTIAYQNIPSALVACLAYLGPILSVLIDILFFRIHYGLRALLGCAVVLFFGLYLPLRKNNGPAVKVAQ